MIKKASPEGLAFFEKGGKKTEQPVREINFSIQLLVVVRAEQVVYFS